MTSVLARAGPVPMRSSQWGCIHGGLVGSTGPSKRVIKKKKKKNSNDDNEHLEDIANRMDGRRSS